MKKCFQSDVNLYLRKTLAFTCSKLTIETLEQGVKSVQKLTVKIAEALSGNRYLSQEQICHQAWLRISQQLIDSSRLISILVK